MVTPAGLLALQTHLLTKVQSQILWHLVANLVLGGDVIVNSLVAEELSLTRKQVNSALKRFEECGFLMRGAKLTRSYHYKLNPALFRIVSA